MIYSYKVNWRATVISKTGRKLISLEQAKTSLKISVSGKPSLKLHLKELIGEKKKNEHLGGSVETTRAFTAGSVSKILITNCSLHCTVRDQSPSMSTVTKPM